MALLTLSHIGQSFGANTIFSNLSAQVQRDSKIGIVGPNGIGKTSLLLIIAGLAEPSAGTITRAKGLRLGYLHQDAAAAFGDLDQSLYDGMLSAFDDLFQIEAQMRELELIMGEDTSVLDRYGDLQEAYELRGGYDYDLRIAQTLAGLGFGEEDWTLPLRHLSGGQKTRALLARLLLEQPDLLILDEPTNHLDVDAIAWLESTLNRWPGALLVVSHDRYFLDAVANTIWEMSRGGLETYRGDYTAYTKQREERWEYREMIYQQEKARLESELDYVKRNIARASTRDQAYGRLRRLSREIEAIGEVGILAVREAKSWLSLGVGVGHTMSVQEVERRIHALQSPNPPRPPKLNLQLNITQQGSDVAIRTRDLCIGYPHNPLFTADNAALYRGECAALIGGNGTGKTTFLRTILGDLELLDGQIKLGANLKIGYFSQAHSELNPENTVLDELLRHKHMAISAARGHLARFLFRADDVYKRVGALSGGERGKLVLAILALRGANLLLLDEPTNHLDIAAQEVLQEALSAFEGTILLVTHDRYLVDKLAGQIWHIEDGHMTVFRGTYREYLNARRVKV